VHTRMQSSSVASIPRCSSAHLAAHAARSEVATSGAAMCRSDIPRAFQYPLVAGLHHLFEFEFVSTRGGV